jgi:hypothetical protein
MAPSNQFLKLRIALLLAAALMPEIMSKEARDPKACAQPERLTVGQDNKTHRAETTGKLLSEELADSDGVICPPQGVDPHMTAPTPEGGRMPVISTPGSPGGDPNMK